MASAKREIMKFENAVECMGTTELKQCLVKTLNFLNKNNNECCFPNISPQIEAFLVGLASDTRNLKCKLFNAECEKLALEIIEVLELNREVFRWTFAYESGTVNKDLFVYKKIFSNKMKMIPAEPKKSKKSVSLISQRLIIAQSQDATQTQFDIPTGSKIQLLNTTLRFLKTDGEGVFEYPDMPTTHAQYMCMLFNSPKSDLNVGFGFKSLYAPLFEAMDLYGLDYEFKISFTEKNGDIASLKLKKLRRNKVFLQKEVTQEDRLDKKSTKENSFENSSRSESILETNSKGSNNSLNISLNSSTSSKRSRNRRCRNRLKLTEGVSPGFVSDTLHSLIEFTADAARASVTFEGLTDREAAFVKGVKTLAASTSSHGSLEAPLRESLEQLNSNVDKLLATCKIRVQEGQTNSKTRFITLKKVPRKTLLSAIKLPTKSRGFLAAGSKDGSTSKDNLIQFKSAGKLDPCTGEIEQATDNVESGTDGAQGAAKTKDNLNRRKAKLLEAMSVPVDSDKGKRMMELMGWAGGALGARGGGILEPILPAIELPVGAGLGHVPPQKPETRRPADFRLSILHNIRDLLLHTDSSKVIEYKLPLTKKEKSYVNNALPNLNKGKTPKVGVKEEVDLVNVLLKEMPMVDPDLRIKADISPDLRKVTLTKCKKTKKSNTLQLGKLKAYDPPTVPAYIPPTAPIDCEVVDDDAIKEVMGAMSHTNCKTPVAVKARAMRMLFLSRFIDLMRGSRTEREFRFVGAMQKKMLAFLENVVTSINSRVRCSHVADEEMHLFDELMCIARKRECYLDIAFYYNTKFVLRKMSDRTVVQQNVENVANSTCPKPQDTSSIDQKNKSVTINRIINRNVANNSIVVTSITIPNNSDKSSAHNETRNQNEPQDTSSIDQQNKSVTINRIINRNVANNSIVVTSITIPNNSDKSSAHNETRNQNEPISKDNEIADGENHKEVTKVKSKCDSEANALVQNESPDNSVKVEDVKKEAKSDMKKVSRSDNVRVEKVAKMQNECDMKRKDNVINSIIKDKSIFKKEIKTDDDDTENSWSTLSENEVDLSVFDKEIEELDNELGEVGLGFNVRDSDTSVSPASDSQDYNKVNAKKTKLRCKNCVVVIAPKSKDTKMHTEMFKAVQTLIWNQIDKEDYAIPLLKCHGVQNGGLVYSCHDDKDVAWLKRTIKAANLNLKILVFADDFIEDKKSRKLAIKINSFMPLDAKKVFSKFELYNDIDTQLWKVLSYEYFYSYVIFIVEVDEISFEYISEDNFSLYMGIDKAQFSIIF